MTHGEILGILSVHRRRTSQVEMMVRSGEVGEIGEAISTRLPRLVQLRTTDAPIRAIRIELAGIGFDLSDDFNAKALNRQPKPNKNGSNVGDAQASEPHVLVGLSSQPNNSSILL